jgi:hypothetical protein
MQHIIMGCYIEFQIHHCPPKPSIVSTHHQCSLDTLGQSFCFTTQNLQWLPISLRMESISLSQAPRLLELPPHIYLNPCYLSTLLFMLSLPCQTTGTGEKQSWTSIFIFHRSLCLSCFCQVWTELGLQPSSELHLNASSVSANPLDLL